LGQASFWRSNHGRIAELNETVPSSFTTIRWQIASYFLVSYSSKPWLSRYPRHRSSVHPILSHGFLINYHTPSSAGPDRPTDKDT
ncbi:hypothetical protein CI238_11495, partial [Colletotrichum incanum]